VIYVGTSGWQYDDWRGAFYPMDLPKRHWLGYFAERFPTVEVNNSFYRLPSKETFARWRAESSKEFVIGLKASRYITHIRRLRGCRDAVRLLWSHAGALREKLGPVLFQLPPNFRADPGLLEHFTRLLPRAMQPAFEFRDPSWNTEQVHGVLDRAGAALVAADRPGARVRGVVTGGWAYLRFHQGRKDSPGYTREKLKRWADRIATLDARDVFVYFNNDEECAGVRDARTLARLLAERLPRAAASPI